MHAALGNAVRARCRALIGRERRVAFHQMNALDRQAEFLGGDLRESGAQSGAEIDLAGIDRHRAVCVDGNIGIDLRRIHGLADALALGAGGCCERAG